MRKIFLCVTIFCCFPLAHAVERGEDVVYRLFEWYRNYSEKAEAVPTIAELECFFTPDFHVISNGIEVCTSCRDYLPHFSTLKNNCRSARTSPFLEEPIISDDKVVIRYNADVEEISGRKVQLQVIAILTLEQGKISKWVEVLHETSPIYW
ncbi:MAG TPA: nuclear transport factor 2 family protein [Chlamydiales bacterium]|nr:nuclear transport factor 2 family protein [Chlamydiales bacterium]